MYTKMIRSLGIAAALVLVGCSGGSSPSDNGSTQSNITAKEGDPCMQSACGDGYQQSELFCGPDGKYYKGKDCGTLGTNMICVLDGDGQPTCADNGSGPGTCTQDACTQDGTETEIYCLQGQPSYGQSCGAMGMVCRLDSNGSATCATPCVQDTCANDGTQTQQFCGTDGILENGQDCAQAGLVCNLNPDASGLLRASCAQPPQCTQDQCDGNTPAFCNNGEIEYGQDCSAMGLSCHVDWDDGNRQFSASCY
jgi:hypothetical protein